MKSYVLVRVINSRETAEIITHGTSGSCAHGLQSYRQEGKERKQEHVVITAKFAGIFCRVFLSCFLSCFFVVFYRVLSRVFFRIFCRVLYRVLSHGQSVS